MDRRIETRVVDTSDGALTTLIQRDACEVWWITVNITKAQSGVLQIYDGFDVNGKLEWQFEGATEPHHCNFIPPIACDMGITVYNDASIANYTIAFRPKSWKKETP